MVVVPVAVVVVVFVVSVAEVVVVVSVVVVAVVVETVAVVVVTTDSDSLKTHVSFDTWDLPEWHEPSPDCTKMSPVLPGPTCLA